MEDLREDGQMDGAADWFNDWLMAERIDGRILIDWKQTQVTGQWNTDYETGQKYEIWVSHGSESVDVDLMGFDAEWTYR